MKPFDLQSLEKAFSEALSRTEGNQRQAFLKELAEQHPELAAEVRSLLLIEPRSNEFFEAPRRERMRLLMTTLGSNFTLSKNDFIEFLRQAQPPQNTDEIARITDQFALNELIACGATGFIFRGWDCHLDRKVAIKVLAPSICKEPRHRAAFIDEARFTSQINHPNVVTIYHVASGNIQDPNVFFVMEWIEGVALQAQLESQPQLLRNEAPTILHQLCKGLTAVHKRGIIHRDIKPGNILIENATGRAVIIDFGLAFESNVVDAHLPAGTPLFMSPEQIMGQKLTDRSDQFSFAVVAFQLLTGQHPFPGNSIEELLENIRTAKHFIETSHHAISDSATAVFCKAFSASPQDRYESVEDFFNQLCEACPGLSPLSLSQQASTGAATVQPATAKKRFSTGQKASLLAGATLAATTLGYLGFTDLFRESNQDQVPTVSQSATAETPRPNVTPAPALPGITPRTRERRWIDENTMINFVGIEFAKVPAPSDFAEPFSHPPFPSHPEYTEGFDWSYYERPFLISKSPITYRQYFDVMGKFPPFCDRNGGFPTDMNEPITNIRWREALQFCEEMSRLEGQPNKYAIPEFPNWTFAAYGQEMLSAPEAAETIEARMLGVLTDTSVPSLKTPLSDPYGGLWEFTANAKPTYQATEGLVSLSEWGRRRNADEYVLAGRGAEDFFVHWFDLNTGCNDNFVSLENLTPYTETDQITSYLRPTELGKRGSIIYRYQATAPITSALVQPSMFLHHERSECGIQIRARSTNSAIPLSELPWSDVLQVRGKYIDAPPIDITPFVAGMDEFEIQYWILTDEEPLHYSQIFRAALTTRTTRVAGCAVRWTTQRNRPSVRPTGPIPEHYADSKVTFRVQTLLDRE